MTDPGRLTVEQGRAMVRRARAYRALEIAGIVASGIAIPLFGLSYLELRDIDVATLAGGDARVPYFAWAMIALFVTGTALAFAMRLLVLRISRMLEAEQRRRWVERDTADGAAWGAEEAGSDEPPAAAG